MVLQAVGLKTSIWNNNIRSLLLLGLYPLIVMGLAWIVAGIYGVTMTAPYSETIPWSAGRVLANSFIVAYWPTILGAVAIWFMISFFFHGRMIRALSHAKPVTREEEPELYNLLENLCISRGLSMPRLEIIDTDALNAFASGIDKKSYAITVTRGLMQALSRDEMEAVLGHELTHIINNDVRLLMVCIVFTGMIGFTSQMLWSGIRRNLLYSRRRRNEKGDARVMIFVAIVALVLWLGYMATLFTRFALSRRREFMADAGSIELTKNPEAMMRALLRISGKDRIPEATADIALMCIENSHPFMGLFATHPSIDQRVAAIAQLTGTPVPQEAMQSPDGKPRNPWVS
jgi:heat shock protein HtpX